ncbi:glycogen/starch synthase, ADP-glucose type [Rippkaea orientalis PCC 8801]|uniref:Glycogen synthase n=1 Tax=Rippkaea orientalis (strain PCC 8801 / RF-1) TaxID=41431 RepID=B7JYQ5_RIPO1|nr:glycogen synthase GlgA [Rippkaea orientalis]ACK64925.1 glycogen/starch synthase, ADP-glucose type [Rippkaea orientalis PCC 8801]
MYIVQIASECAPAIKAGGLGDVVYGLSRGLSNQGHNVEIILPKYDCMRYDQIGEMSEAYQDLWVPWNNGSIHCTVLYAEIYGQKCFFIESHSNENFFNRNKIYGDWDDPLRFAFFSKASLEFLLKSGKRPDIIHCHDGQTGLIPVLLYEIYQHQGMGNQRVCYTIHNFKHQSVALRNVLGAAGLGDHLFTDDRLKDNGRHDAINFMKGGIVYANHVTTVSPHHAWEARFSSEGYGLGSTLGVHHEKFSGILNGIDDKFWNPKVDKYLPTNYGIADFELKARNKKALRERLWLRDPDKPTPRPIVAYIGRLDAQKGVDLVLHAIDYALFRSAQFVLLGSPTGNELGRLFGGKKNHFNNNPDVHLELTFNEELSHLVYAGADMMIVPSNYEPCGLTQMISLRYGTVPIVRGVGGLKNTVFDVDYDESIAPEKRNGYVFYQTDHSALDSALGRAIDLWYNNPEDFVELAKQGMRYDYSWKDPAQEYVKVYDKIRVPSAI